MVNSYFQFILLLRIGEDSVLDSLTLGVAPEHSQHLYNVIETVYLGGGQVRAC